MYIISGGDYYVTVEPVLNFEGGGQYPVCLAWTRDKHGAVRFATRWQAMAVAKALKKTQYLDYAASIYPKVIRVSD